MKVLAAQALAVDLAKQRGNGLGRLGLRHRSGVAIGHFELPEGVLGHAELVVPDDARVVHHIERGEDALAVGAHLHLGQGLEALGPVDRAVAVQVGHVLVVGVDGHAPERQAAVCGARLIGEGLAQSAHGIPAWVRSGLFDPHDTPAPGRGYPTTSRIPGMKRSDSARRSSASRMFICATSVCSTARACARAPSPRRSASHSMWCWRCA